MSDQFHSDSEELDEFPDQELFEPDPELESRKPTRFQKIWPYLRVVIGIVALVSLFYFSGLYQALLLSPTPSVVKQEVLSSKIDAPELTVPIKVYVVVTEDSISSERSRSNITQLVQKADNIWAQANIDILLRDIEVIALSENDSRIFISDPGSVIRSLSERHSGEVVLVLSGTLSGLNGVAYQGQRGIGVADVTSHYDFRTLAHELGHIFDLRHTSNSARLMSQASYGTSLTIDEIKTARAYVQDRF